MFAASQSTNNEGHKGGRAEGATTFVEAADGRLHWRRDGVHPHAGAVVVSVDDSGGSGLSVYSPCTHTRTTHTQRDKAAAATVA